MTLCKVPASVDAYIHAKTNMYYLASMLACTISIAIKERSKSSLS